MLVPTAQRGIPAVQAAQASRVSVIAWRVACSVDLRSNRPTDRRARSRERLAGHDME